MTIDNKTDNHQNISSPIQSSKNQVNTLTPPSSMTLKSNNYINLISNTMSYNTRNETDGDTVIQTPPSSYNSDINVIKQSSIELVTNE